MAKVAVVKAGGKQYLVKENDEIVVDKLDDAKKDLTLETLAVFDDAGEAFELGVPTVKTSAKAQIVEQGKGEKIRVARFKAKVRYRRVTGFRPQLTKIKIVSI